MTLIPEVPEVTQKAQRYQKYQKLGDAKRGFWGTFSFWNLNSADLHCGIEALLLEVAGGLWGWH